MSGSTRAVRSRAAAVTSTAESSRDRTQRAISSADSSQISPGLSLIGAPFHLGDGEKLAESGGGSVGEEELAGQAGARHVRRLPHRRGGGGAGFRPVIGLKLVD